jgi:hypothetical protein
MLELPVDSHLTGKRANFLKCKWSFEANYNLELRRKEIIGGNNQRSKNIRFKKDEPKFFLTVF